MAAKKTPPKARVSRADEALFREAVGPIRPIQAPDPVRTLPPAPRPRQREADEADALHSAQHGSLIELADGGEALSYRRDHIPPRLLRRLARGQFVAQDEIDLHRMTVAVARAALRRFLGEARRDGLTCVRIVHGKGQRSEAGLSVLKPLVADLLARRSEVLAFASAPAAQGGTGAVLVLLDRSRG